MNATASTSPFIYLTSAILPITIITCNVLGGWFVLVPIVLVYGVYVVLDVVLGASTTRHAEQPTYVFDAILYLHVMLQVFCIASLLWLALREGFTWVTFAGAFATGTCSGTATIVIGHELIHRRSAVVRGLGIFLLGTVHYMHFYIEHNRGHHRFVATDRDPASARADQGLWEFVVKTVPGQIASAWQISKTMDGRLNPVLVFFAIEIATTIVVFLLLGPVAAAAWVYHSLVAISLLEYVNYIRHWGLRRNPGEPVRARHSWQSNQRWSRWVLVELTRHADHHMTASKEYWKLTTYDEGPFLPSGYFGCFYLVIIPPLWFHVMRKKLPA